MILDVDVVTGVQGERLMRLWVRLRMPDRLVPLRYPRFAVNVVRATAVAVRVLGPAALGSRGG